MIRFLLSHQSLIDGTTCLWATLLLIQPPNWVPGISILDELVCHAEWTVHLLVFCAYLRLVLSSSTLILKTLKDIWILWVTGVPVLDLWWHLCFLSCTEDCSDATPVTSWWSCIHGNKALLASYFSNKGGLESVHMSVILYGKVCVSSGLTFTLTLKDKIRQNVWTTWIVLSFPLSCVVSDKVISCFVVWNLVVIATERYLAVCQPFKHNNFTRGRVLVIFGLIYITAVLLNSIAAFEVSDILHSV